MLLLSSKVHNLYLRGYSKKDFLSFLHILFYSLGFINNRPLFPLEVESRTWGGSVRFARLMNPSNAINYYCDRTQSIRTRCSKGLTSVRWPPFAESTEGMRQARFMNNVIRATTVIMGIIRYPSLHVRQQTARPDTHIRSYVCAFPRVNRTLLASTRKPALPTCESVLCTPRCISKSQSGKT